MVEEGERQKRRLNEHQRRTKEVNEVPWLQKWMEQAQWFEEHKQHEVVEYNLGDKVIYFCHICKKSTINKRRADEVRKDT